MSPTKAQLGADLQGAVRLSAQATAGMVDLVEAVHARIARVPGLGANVPERTRGITGLVYQTIRGVTRLVGGSLDALLGLITSALDANEAKGAAGDAAAATPSPPNAEREALVAALNGVLGDHLAASGNPLAIQMSLRHQGRPLVMETSALQQAFPRSQGRLLVLLHGLCMNDLQWQREGHDHGAALARELGYTPLYLHYNSGLPIATNGAAFAQQMAALSAAWPYPIERLVLLGHSMGGLVARSALQAAQAAGSHWPTQVSDVVFLGTPHHGAPLERAGHWVDQALAATPYLAPLARLGRVRSAGIQDLRHGLSGPLPTNIRCYAIAGQLGEPQGHRPSGLKGRLLGDGLVPLDSALGRHAQSARQLAFKPSDQWVGQGLNHMQLLSQPELMLPLRQWLR
jgi:pimeloyl-ACP methyl ester carboxylesterase